MTEVIVIIALVLLNAWTTYEYHVQQKKLIKALLSKNVEEFTYSELAEKPQKKEKPIDEDLVPVSELSDEDFMKAIKKQKS